MLAHKVCILIIRPIGTITTECETAVLTSTELFLDRYHITLYEISNRHVSVRVFFGLPIVYSRLFVSFFLCRYSALP